MPHITALPATTTINVNTMSEVIFQSLGEEGDVTRFVEERKDNPYESIEDFVERLQLPLDVEGLSVDTRFFRAHGQVVQGEQVFNLNTLVYRDDKGATSIFNRSLGIF